MKRVARVLGRFTRDWRRHRIYKVSWFSEWRPEIDAAIETLPEAEGCPHELYQLLATNPGPAVKRIALITEKDVPVAVVPLRRREDDWAPVTHYLVPGALFPARKEHVADVADALGVNLFLAWWRQPVPPPAFDNARAIVSLPTYKMPCGSEIEAYWRKQGHLLAVKRKRRRCEAFQIVTDFPAALEWVTRQWELQWRPPGTPPLSDLEDRIVAAQYLERAGAHYTHVVLDGDKPIAGNTYIAHGNELAWMCSYRDANYDRYGLGYRLLDFSHQWATQAGFQKIDLGGGHDHFKSRWGPSDGEKWEIQICPEFGYRARQWRGVWGNLKSAVKKRLQN